ncbi:MAG: hypothetical protein ACTSXQ_06390 [Alphaproteobacteria bacterium]
MIKKIMLYTAVIALCIFSFSGKTKALEISKNVSITVKGQKFILPLPQDMVPAFKDALFRKDPERKNTSYIGLPDTIVEWLTIPHNESTFPFSTIDILVDKKDLLSPPRSSPKVLIDQKAAENTRGKILTFMDKEINLRFLNMMKTDDMLIYIDPFDKKFRG